MKRLLEARTRQQVDAYRTHVPADAPLAVKLKALAALREQEGFMPETRADRDGSFSLIENHCPVCIAARACPGLCASEQEVFEQVLGPGVSVERTEHIGVGDRRCVYRVRQEDGKARSAPKRPAGAR